MSGPGGMGDEVLLTLGLEDATFTDEIAVSEEALNRMEAAGKELATNLSSVFTDIEDKARFYGQAATLAAMQQEDANARAAASFAPLLTTLDEVAQRGNIAAEAFAPLFEALAQIERQASGMGPLVDGFLKLNGQVAAFSEQIAAAARNTPEFDQAMAKLKDTIAQTNISALGLVDGGARRLEGVFAHLEGLATGDADSLARLARAGVEVEDTFDASGQRIADYVQQLDNLAQTSGIYDSAAAAVDRLAGAEENLTVASDRKTASMRQQTDATDADAGSASFLERALALLGVAFERVGSLASSVADRLLVVRDSMFAAEAGTRSFGSGFGEFMLQMAGFSLFNRAAEAVRGLGDAMIGGNITLEKFKQQLVDLTGDQGAAQKLVDWTWKFGTQIPFTTESLQALTVYIASLGNQMDLTTGQEEKIMTQLAQVAAATNTSLSDAGKAFYDALSEHRFLMFMTRLKISKDEMKAFGYDATLTGKALNDSFLAAWDKLVAAKFPATNLTAAMHEFWGETSNLTDQFQQLAIVLGRPLFQYLEDQLFKLETWIQDNRPALEHLATVIGTALAGAVSTLVGWIKEAITWFYAHQQVAKDLAELLGGLLLGVVVKLAGAVVDMGLKFALGFGPWGLVGGVILAVFGRLKDLYDHSPEFRQAVDNLGQAAGRLFEKLQPFIGDAGKIAGGLLQLLDKLISSQAATDVVNHLAAGMQWLGDALTPVSVNGQPTYQFFVMIGPAMERAAQALDAVRQAVLAAVPILAGAGAALGPILAELMVPGGLAGLGAGLTGLDGPLTKVVGLFFELLNSVQGFLEVGLAGGFADVAAALAPVAAVAAAIALAVGSAVAAFLYWWQNSADFRSKIGDLLGALGQIKDEVGGAFAEVWTHLQSVWEQIRPSVEHLGESLQKLAPILIAVGSALLMFVAFVVGDLAALLAGTLDGIATFIDGVVTTIGGLIQAISGAISLVIDFFGNFFTIIGDLFSGNTDKLQADATKMGQQLLADIGNIFGGILTAIWGLIQATLGTLLSFFGGAAQALGQWFWQLLHDIPVVGAIMDFLGQILAAIGAGKDWLVDRLHDLLNVITNAWGALTGQTSKSATDMSTDINNATTSASASVDSMASDIHTQSQNISTDMYNAAVNFGASLDTTVQDMLNATHNYQKARDFDKAMASDYADLIAEKNRKAGHSYSQAADDATQAGDKIANSASNTATSVQKSADSIDFSRLGSLSYKWGTDVSTGFANGISDNIWKILGAVNDAVAVVWKMLHFSKPEEGPLADFDTYAPDMVETFASGIESNLGRLRRAAGQMALTVAAPLSPGATGTFSGVPASSLAGGVGTTGVVVSASINLNGGIAEGWRMLSASDRRDFAELVGAEMARAFDLHSNTRGGWANNGAG